jgi:hypothetical protein
VEITQFLKLTYKTLWVIWFLMLNPNPYELWVVMSTHELSLTFCVMSWVEFGV